MLTGSKQFFGDDNRIPCRHVHFGIGTRAQTLFIRFAVSLVGFTKWSAKTTAMSQHLCDCCVNGGKKGWTLTRQRRTHTHNSKSTKLKCGEFYACISACRLLHREREMAISANPNHTVTKRAYACTHIAQWQRQTERALQKHFSFIQNNAFADEVVNELSEWTRARDEWNTMNSMSSTDFSSSSSSRTAAHFCSFREIFVN